MYLIVDGRVLRNAPLEVARSISLADELHSHPPLTVRHCLGEILRDCAGSDLEGLAPLAVQRMVEKIQIPKSEGLSILLAEQSTDTVLALCDRMHVMEKGSIKTTLTPDEVREDESRLTRYLMI